MKHVLYLTNDGMTDPLGRSQVIPYLSLLSKTHKITIISCEKPHNFKKHSDFIQKLLLQNNIDWVTVPFRNRPPIVSAIWYLYQMYRMALKINQKEPFQMVHCRSNLTSMVGYKLKQKLGVKFLFDMRSFYPDERVDGGLWPQSQWLYRQIYKYFKVREKQLLSAADAVVVLTQAAKTEILSWKLSAMHPDKISVIPCCADLSLFNYEKYAAEEIHALKKKHHLDAADLVLTYLGSVGTWYLLEEMLLFFKELKNRYPKAKFLFITCEGQDQITALARKIGIEPNDIEICCVAREEVPKYILLGDLSVFFITPRFSKKGSSPTKHGEIMGMGVPVIANAGVGDTDEIIQSTQSGMVLNRMDADTFKSGIQQIPALLKIDKKIIRAGAFKHFSLEDGFKTYQGIYNKLMG